MRALLFLALVACAETAEAPTAPSVWDSAADEARIRPRDQKTPVRDPAAPGEAGVLADEKIPCIREGGFGKRCPKGEKCVYDRSEDGTKGAAYCVDSHGEPTGHVPTVRVRQ